MSVSAWVMLEVIYTRDIQVVAFNMAVSWSMVEPKPESAARVHVVIFRWRLSPASSIPLSWNIRGNTPGAKDSEFHLQAPCIILGAHRKCDGFSETVLMLCLLMLTEAMVDREEVE